MKISLHAYGVGCFDLFGLMFSAYIMVVSGRVVNRGRYSMHTRPVVLSRLHKNSRNIFHFKTWQQLQPNYIIFKYTINDNVFNISFKCGMEVKLRLCTTALPDSTLFNKVI